jgi:hypothetical protein
MLKFSVLVIILLAAPHPLPPVPVFELDIQRMAAAKNGGRKSIQAERHRTVNERQVPRIRMQLPKNEDSKGK